MRVDIKGTIISNDVKWIYNLFAMDSCCPKDISSAIEKANGEKLDVYINSGGGSVFAGSEIYSTLREYRGGVKIHVVGLAGSAASVIMCAGKSDIALTAMVMIHNVSSYAEGDYNDMEHARDMLKSASRSIAAAYTAKTGKSEKEMLSLMDRETWFTAKDAVEIGLVDEIAADTGKLVAAVFEPVIPAEVINKVGDMVNEMNKLKAELRLEKLGGAK